MTSIPAVPGPAAAGQHLAAIAASLYASGLTPRLTRPGGTPVLTVDAPGSGPDPASIAIHPDPYACPGPGLGPQFDCTCTWTPAPGASPQVTAATITAILAALCPACGLPGEGITP